MRRSGRPATVILLVLAGGLALPAALPSAGRGSAADDLDARRRAAFEASVYARRLAGELAAGRLGLRETTDRYLEAHADLDSHLAGLHTRVGCPTLRESVARCLVYRVEGAPGAAAEHPALRAEYAALFGRPYTPPIL